MFLQEEKAGLLKGWNFEIHATDLNDRSIETARAGIYGDYALRNTSDSFKRKYFSPAEGGKLRVRDEMRAYITFSRLNLNDDSRMLFMKGMDLIFCCNVLIYFEHGVTMTIPLNPDLLPDLLASMQQSQLNQSIATQEMGTGRSVNQLADNPASSAALVRTHDQENQDPQYLQNLTSLQGRFQVADSALGNVTQVLTRALSLGTEGANGTMTTADRQSIAEEVQGLLGQTVGLANSTCQGAYLFGGTQVNTQPFTLDTATNTVTYQGNTASTSVELSNGNSISANLPGSQIVQNAGGSVMGALQDLYTALQTGNNVSGAVTEISNALKQVDGQRVFYGNALNQINQSESFLNQEQLNLSQQENGLAGADMAAVATNFAQAQIASQATINATAKVLSLPTLLDYLK